MSDLKDIEDMKEATKKVERSLAFLSSLLLGGIVISALMILDGYIGNFAA